METIQIADGQIFLLLLRGLLVAAIPFAAFFRLRQKHGGRGFPVFVGVITVMLILLPRELFRNVLIKGSHPVPPSAHSMATTKSSASGRKRVICKTKRFKTGNR